MSNLTSTGAKLYISTGLPASENQAGYEALTWIQIKGVTTIAPFGATISNIESKPLETGIVENDKGFRNYGEMSANTIVIPSDLGQIAALEASEGAKQFDEHSFKVEFAGGSARYSQGKVYDFTEDVGSADQTVNGTINIKLNKAITRVNV